MQLNDAILILFQLVNECEFNSVTEFLNVNDISYPVDDDTSIQYIVAQDKVVFRVCEFSHKTYYVKSLKDLDSLYQAHLDQTFYRRG